MENLKGAGAQKTVVNIVNQLNRKQWRPILALYSRSGEYLDSIRDDVEVVELGCSRPRSAVVAITRAIRAYRPNLVFSTLLYNNVATVLGVKLSAVGVPVVVRESNNQTASGRKRKTLSDWFVGWAYRHANQVVALSAGVRNDVMDRYKIAPRRVSTVYNPIDIDHIKRGAAQGDNAVDIERGGAQFDILAVGRLHRQKGFDLLIQACAALKKVPWRLTILGEGEERVVLETLIAKLGVQDHVRLPGFYKNPYAWMARTDLFVLSSRWEGFGHVIAEAMVCGAPVLATRCPSGPDEIITDRVDGRLCKPDSWTELYRHIQELADHSEERRKYAMVAAQSVRRFDMRTIVAQYEQLFNTLMMHDDDKKS